MTKNQKIALGCGGAGCLGLIVAAIAGVLIFYFSMGPSGRNTNFNSSTNRNSNDSRSTNRNSISNDNDNSSASNDNSSSSTSSMSDDDRHKLWQAASFTQDAELVRRVSVKLGLVGEDYTPTAEYATFLKDHFTWAVRNGEFIQSVNTKEKAMAYVNEHFDE